MNAFLEKHFTSRVTVVLVLFLVFVIQSRISYSLSIGKLANLTEFTSWVMGTWAVVRMLALAFVVVTLFLDRKDALFKGIIVTNAMYTVGLFANIYALSTILAGMTQSTAGGLLRDAFFLAVANMLIFSIWYWIMDPPGIGEMPRADERWDFLFPQRAGESPQFEGWRPRYADYLFLAFTTTFAFSPTDSAPLTIRAKLAMIVQTIISAITIIVLVGNAINVL